MSSRYLLSFCSRIKLLFNEGDAHQLQNGYPFGKVIYSLKVFHREKSFYRSFRQRSSIREGPGRALGGRIDANTIYYPAFASRIYILTITYYSALVAFTA